MESRAKTHKSRSTLVPIPRAGTRATAAANRGTKKEATLRSRNTDSNARAPCAAPCRPRCARSSRRRATRGSSSPPKHENAHTQIRRGRRTSDEKHSACETDRGRKRANTHEGMRAEPSAWKKVIVSEPSLRQYPQRHIQSVKEKHQKGDMTHRRSRGQPSGQQKELNKHS